MADQILAVGKLNQGFPIATIWKTTEWSIAAGGFRVMNRASVEICGNRGISYFCIWKRSMGQGTAEMISVVCCGVQVLYMGKP